jgi:hypothetical protein
MEKNWSVHAEFIIIFFTLLGGYFMIQQDIASQTARIDQVNTRTDQLYQMFCDLRKDSDQRFYDLLKSEKNIIIK